MKDASATAAWLNGAVDTQALATHRGLHYGDGVFRTCLIHQGAVVALARQLDTLERDASRIDLAPDRAALEREATVAAQGIARGALKILLLRSGAERGYRSVSVKADRLLCRYPLPQYRDAAQGIRAGRAHFKLANQPTLAGIKHLNRLEQVLASRAFPEDLDERVLEDDTGAPVCGTRSNLFWVKGGRMFTPPVDRCGVAGLTRQRVLEQGGEVRPASFGDLEGADELFFTNSLVGIWPVARYESRTFNAPGPVTRRALLALNHPRGP